MINALRKHQKVLMIVITVLVIIAFVWLYNGTQRNTDPRSSLPVGRIYGRPVSIDEFQREEKKFYLCVDLGLFELVQSLAGTSQKDASETFVWNSRILKHEAEELQIRPTDEEVVAAVKELRPFQTQGTFDPQKYALFTEHALAPRGFTQAQLEELVRDDLRARKIKTLLGATFETPPAEFRDAYQRQFQKVQASVIRLRRADFAPTTEPTEEEIGKAFEQGKDTFKSEEQRRVTVASFLLGEEAKALKGRERIEALQKLVDRASELTQAMLEPHANFQENAAKFEAAVFQTAAFTRAATDPQLAEAPAVTAAAFGLTTDNPNTDSPVQTDKGFYVLHLDEIIPSRPLTLEEARPKIVERIKQDRTTEALNLKANELRGKITAELKAGKSFAEAATAAGATAEAFPPFSLSERNVEAPDSREVMATAPDLAEGELSNFVPSAEGGLLVHLDKREPLDEAKFEKDKAALLTGFDESKRELVFQEWLRLRRATAKLQTAGTRS